MSYYQGKKIWLVGASEGIGEAVARRLAAAGATLAISARSAGKIQALAKELPGNHIAVGVDVTQLDSVHNAWQEVETRLQGVDIVFYNAGIYDPLRGRHFDLAKTERMVDVNFSGALRVLADVIPAFIKQGGGQIVLVSSVAGYSGLPNAIGYGASKAALTHLAENLRLDLKDQNIKVQAVMPGFVKTRLTDQNDFNMPFIVSADLAADRIVQGMTTDRFDIHFPRRFSLILKFFRLLPYPLYFKLVSLLPET